MIRSIWQSGRSAVRTWWNTLREHPIAGPILVVYAVLLIPAVPIVMFIQRNWASMTLASKASVSVAILGALATFLLASITIFSVFQNQEAIKEQKREREKPIVVELINKVIEPQMEYAESDLSSLRKHETNIDWVKKNVRTAERDDNLSFLKPSEITSPQHMAVARRFRRDYPEIMELIEERNQIISEGNDIAEDIRGDLHQYIAETVATNISTKEEVDISVYNISDAIIHQNEDHLETEDESKIWESNKETFLGMKNHFEDQFKQLEKKENKLVFSTMDIQDDLGITKLELREEYGISHDDLRGDNNRV
jgi:flagellar biosynthesis component FlhA